MQPLVSILIPAYNAESWIGSAIESALEQTWSPKEIIVVDDGSVDETLSRARRFESKRVKVISQMNQGASGARNAALRLCQGDYIQWLDADDILASDKISQQLKRTASCWSPRTLLASAWGTFYYRLHKARIVPNTVWKDLSASEWMIRRMEDNAWMAIESWLVARELAEKAGPWDTRLLIDNDGEYFCRLVRVSTDVIFVPEARSFCLGANLGSLSRARYSEAKLESLFQSMALQIDYLRSLDDGPRAKASCLKHLQRMLIYFYPERQSIVKKANALAAELGGHLEAPQLRPKYAAMQRVFGWTITKKAQSTLPRAKAQILCSWDRLLAAVDRTALCS